MKLIVIFLLAWFTLGTKVYSQSTCKNNTINYFICDMAQDIQKQVASELPIQVDSSLQIEGIVAVDNKLIVQAVLMYDYAFLSWSAQMGGRTLASLNTQMRQFTRNSVCNGVFKKFLKQGGLVTHQYNFDDGELYLNTTVSLSDCN